MLAACGSDSDDPTLTPFDGIAVVQSKGGGSSQIEFTDGKSIIQSEFLPQIDDDYAVFAHGEFFYQLGRGSNDSIQKYHIDNPQLGYYPNDGYILKEIVDGQPTSANPYNMAFLNDGSNTAVITRYGQAESWVVDLNAQSFEDFVIHKLDLSHHDDSSSETDSDPEADMVFISGNRAFITMQNLDGWTPDNAAKVAVFDTTTWQEIDTDPSTDGVQAISMTLKNHQSGAIHGNTIYLGSLIYANATGGLEKINTDTFATEVITDEKAVSQVAVDSLGNVFFADYAGWQDNSLYAVNDDNSIGLVSEALTSLFITTLTSPGDSIWMATSATDNDTNNLIQRIDSSLDYTEPKTIEEAVLSSVQNALQVINIAFLESEKEVPETPEEPVLEEL